MALLPNGSSCVIGAEVERHRRPDDASPTEYSCPIHGSRCTTHRTRPGCRLPACSDPNEPLAVAYYLKEDLRQIWEQDGKREAGKFLTDWRKRATASGIGVLQTMANTLQKHRQGILAWYNHPISTGPLEGLNNKIKTMKRQAYGFLDLEYFKLKIYALHLAKFELIG